MELKARVPSDFRELVRATAATAGASINDFVMQACEEKIARAVGPRYQQPAGSQRDERMTRAIFDLTLEVVRAVVPEGEQRAKARAQAWIAAQQHQKTATKAQEGATRKRVSDDRR